MAQPFNSPATTPDPEGDLAFLQAALSKQAGEAEVVKKLSIHIATVWDQNQRDNKQVRLEMINSLRRVRGEYDTQKLAMIRAFRGSEAYARSGENKARAAESWMKDIYLASADPIFEIEPTAVPDLPDETKEQLKQQCMDEANQAEQQLLMTGQPMDGPTMAKLLTEYHEELLDKETEKLEKSARDRCKRAAKKIEDQNQEGGWNAAFKDFLYYFVRLKAGIIKGPTLTKKPKQEWQRTEAGFTLETVDTLVNDVYCVSPFNFFPSKGMKNVNDGDLIELHELSKQAIASLLDTPGYSDEEIRAVLAEYSGKSLKAKWFTLDDETAVKQVTQEKNGVVALADSMGENLWAMEFWGTVSGQMLMEWGVQGELDPAQQYQCNCWKIGTHVIKAVINPDNLGRKPYHVSSWAKNPEWIWGEGLIEFAAWLEDAINAVIRALINNVAIASGPMCEEDSDRIPEDTPLFPWKKIRSTSMQMKSDGPAVNFYQPMMHAQELITVVTFLLKLLDEYTVPAYAQGASQSGVTAGTATVFTQLLAAA